MSFATKCTSSQAYAFKDTLTVTKICHEVTDCSEQALVTNLFVANIRRLLDRVLKVEDLYRGNQVRTRMSNRDDTLHFE